MTESAQTRDAGSNAPRRIRKLAPDVVEQIAAGEVVERPASVLKELVENALDAGSRVIRVKAEEGGLKFLSVSDEGTGIEREDLRLAFEQHATSKLSDGADLWRIETLGFRGEALSSVARVADVTIRTSTINDRTSSEIRCLYGDVQMIQSSDKRRGTVVEVRGLFDRTPARFQFLKSTRAESMALLHVMKRYALGFPHVKFQFEQDGVQKLDRSEEPHIDRMRWFFDLNRDFKILEEKFDAEGWTFHLCFLPSEQLGHARSGVHLYVNERPVRELKLETAVRKAYEGYALEPRQATAVLWISAPPEELDVNVHPQKTEIRFSNEDWIFSQIFHAIRNCLSRAHRVAFLEPSAPGPAPAAFSNPVAISSPATNETRIPFDVQKSSAPLIRPITTNLAPLTQTQLSFERGNPWQILGQWDQTYRFVIRDQQLFIFDQHALHERVLYERWLKRYREHQSLEKQRLLMPENIQGVSLSESLQMALEQLGFEIRQWKDDAIQILSTPAGAKPGWRKIFEEVVRSQFVDDESFLRDWLARFACHSAVRAHDFLSDAEVNQLLKDFEFTDALGHCPHGRPTFIKWSLTDFEKLFQRIPN